MQYGSTDRQEQFGQGRSSQFGQRRNQGSKMPYIIRKTILLNSANQVIAEVPEILQIDAVKTRYADVARVVWIIEVKFGWEKITALEASIPLNALSSIDLGGDTATAEEESDPLADILSDPARLAVVTKVLSAQPLEPAEAQALSDLMKSFFMSR